MGSEARNFPLIILRPTRTHGTCVCALHHHELHVPNMGKTDVLSQLNEEMEERSLEPKNDLQNSTEQQNGCKDLTFKANR